MKSPKLQKNHIPFLDTTFKIDPGIRIMTPGGISREGVYDICIFAILKLRR